MKYLFIWLSLSLTVAANAQGVNFDHTLTWEQVKTKAKAENKYIFVDCYASWCAPCIKLLKEVFPLKELGDFFNDKFICIKLQLDQTDKDDEYVKMWYNDVRRITEKHPIPSLPTFLYFSPDGELVHREPGFVDVKNLIAKSREALDPDRQYYRLLATYEQSVIKTPEMTRRLAIASQLVFEKDKADQYAQQYLETQSNLLTKENIIFISRFIRSSKDTGFTIYLNHGGRVDEVMGKSMANTVVRNIIFSEELVPLLPKGAAEVPDWKAIENTIALKYPVHAEPVLTKFKASYYLGRADWPKFEEVISVLMNKYSEDLHPEEFNNFAWAVFENCPDQELLFSALEWSKRLQEKGNNPRFMNTYANLLHKLGDTKKAIKVQEHALELMNINEKEAYSKTLEQMKKGEKTWLN